MQKGEQRSEENNMNVSGGMKVFSERRDHI